jgi:2-hydroxy-6-oxonona-2,4-dienedioate hydrolase
MASQQITADVEAPMRGAGIGDYSHVRRTFLVIVAVLTAAAAFVYAIFARDLASARARLAGRSQVIETSFGTVEYAVMGDGDPVLVVHGAGGGFDQGLDMAAALATRGYRLIVPSRFGYLRSTLPDELTVAMQADAYAELLDRIGARQVFVVGISAGAWSSLQFAIRHPQRCRALVLMVPADHLPAGVPIHGGSLVEAFFNSDFIAWAALKMMRTETGKMSQMMLGTDSAVVHAAEHGEKARVREIVDHLLPVSPRVGGMQFDIKTAAARESLDIDGIVCPVLTISAEDDRFGTAVRAKYIAANVANGKAVIFPTGGHALVGRHADALRESASFLTAIAAASQPHGTRD